MMRETLFQSVDLTFPMIQKLLAGVENAYPQFLDLLTSDPLYICNRLFLVRLPMPLLWFLSTDLGTIVRPRFLSQVLPIPSNLTHWVCPLEMLLFPAVEGVKSRLRLCVSHSTNAHLGIDNIYHKLLYLEFPTTKVDEP